MSVLFVPPTPGGQLAKEMRKKRGGIKQKQQGKNKDSREEWGKY